MMDIPVEDLRDIHVIARILIEALEEQVARRDITEGNVLIDAAINCLCYAMKQVDPPLKNEELLRRVKKYLEAMHLSGAPRGVLT